MGTYVNPGNKSFARAKKSLTFIDKSDLIGILNSYIDTEDRRFVVSRPRRFGKTMAITMLSAYYSCGCDSRELFHGLKIEKDSSFAEHLNKYTVIFMDIQGLYLKAKENNRQEDFSAFIGETINTELSELYPQDISPLSKSLSTSIDILGRRYNKSFIFLLDEYDVIYREEKNDVIKNSYTSFLTGLFKDANIGEYIDMVYMTGIFPILKQETHSGLNNFQEYTMTDPAMFADYMGFTGLEVASLCDKFDMSFNDLKLWYDGYRFNSPRSIFCPASVVQAVRTHTLKNYWSKITIAAELLDLVNSKNSQFQEAVKALLVGVPVIIDIDKEGIDLKDLDNLNTVLTILVHLGYLRYNKNNSTVEIPNMEIALEFFDILSRAKDNPAHKLIARSRELVAKTFAHDADEVAKIIEENHDDFSSMLSYNNENDLTCVVLLSYLSLLDDNNYKIERELKAGVGYADIAYIPYNSSKIPIIIELKWDKKAETAIKQIKDRRYTDRFKDYSSVLLVGISYEKDSKKPNYKRHTCIIEQINI